MRNQKPVDVKDRIIARMNALARATEIGLHREMTVEQILQLGEQLYRWIMEPNTKKVSKNGSNNGSNGRPASPKQIYFIRKLLQNVPEKLKKKIEDAIAQGITSQEASEIIETLKKEAQK